MTPEPNRKGTVSEPSTSEVEAERLCGILADEIELNGSKRPNVTQRWLDAARLMIDRDGRTPAQIENAIRWCQGNEFWRANILSMPTLRERYDTLRLQAKRDAPGGGRRTAGDIARAAAADQGVNL